jgi:hypothetical protein
MEVILKLLVIIHILHLSVVGRRAWEVYPLVVTAKT